MSAVYSVAYGKDKPGGLQEVIYINARSAMEAMLFVQKTLESQPDWIRCDVITNTFVDLLK